MSEPVLQLTDAGIIEQLRVWYSRYHDISRNNMELNAWFHPSVERLREDQELTEEHMTDLLNESCGFKAAWDYFERKRYDFRR